MRLQVVETKNAASFYVVKSTYQKGKRSNRIVEKLGTYQLLLEKLDGRDPYEWAAEYVERLNRQEKEARRTVLVPYSPVKRIKKDGQRTYNGGYLFLQKLYHELGLDRICGAISKRHGFAFDLDAILSRLVYGRILFPCSKQATLRLSERLIEPSNFDLHHIYRGLEVLCDESDYIQTQLYQNSKKISKRNTGILYYDCTNFFFEIEQEDQDTEEEKGLRKYGYSKDHKPNPIVQMGLFMDGDGVPLAFCINPGNTNEQITLQPLERKILKDFDLSRFVVCTDAGLSSADNRMFNDRQERAFVTTQSVKKLKADIKKWALSPTGWRLTGNPNFYDITQLNEEDDLDKTFYKERWVEDEGLRQRLIVSFSLKYKHYQQKIRAGQIERAQKAIDSDFDKISLNQNDYRRFIQKNQATQQGELATKTAFSINLNRIEQEAQYDGFYAVCTNLDDDVAEILRVNKRRWEIEESFRVMKSEFKARPVYLSRNDRIRAHFITCFIALLLFRILEKRLQEKYSSHQIIDTLKTMDFLAIEGEGYTPVYTRTDLTDDLHNTLGFFTDYELISSSYMKSILSATKS